MSNYDKATKAIIDGDTPPDKKHSHRPDEWTIGPERQVPESARWHMRHRAYGGMGEYERLVKQAREGEKGE